MTKLMKSILVVLIFAALSVPSAPSHAASLAEWEEVDYFPIGVSNHITGTSALSGRHRANGYNLGLEEVNEAGGINGLPVKLIYEDDQGSTTGAVAAVRRLLSQHPILALQICRSSIVNAVHPIILEEKVPTLFGATAWSISELKNPWYFRMRVNDKDTAAIMAKFIVEDLKKTKIASLHDADVFGQGGDEETKKYLKSKYGITPITTQKYTSGTKDFTAQLLAIKESGAEVVYCWGTNSEDNAIILRQFKQLGLQMDLIGSAAYCSSVTLDIAGTHANGIYSVYDFAFEDDRPELQHWVKAYRTKYQEDPDFWALYTYDGTKLIADAAKRAGIVKKDGNKFYIMPLQEAREALAKALRETKGYKGAAGTYSADEYQNMIRQLAVVRIEESKPRLVKLVNLEEDTN